MVLECKTEKRNSQREHGEPMEQTTACFSCVTRVWLSVNHNTSVILANEFDVRNLLHGQVCLAAVNQICVNHEVMNGCKNLKIH